MRRVHLLFVQSQMLLLRHQFLTVVDNADNSLTRKSSTSVSYRVESTSLIFITNI